MRKITEINIIVHKPKVQESPPGAESFWQDVMQKKIGDALVQASERQELKQRLKKLLEELERMNKHDFLSVKNGTEKTLS